MSEETFKDKTIVITKEEQREKAIKELTTYYTSHEKWPINNDKNLLDQLHRLVDYCVDNTENGWAFPEWLTEREKMQIIYLILDKCKDYLINKKHNH